jgi:hypothetical protein
MYKARTYFPVLTFRYTGFMPAFTNPVYLTDIVYTPCTRTVCYYVALRSSSEKLTVIQNWAPSGNSLAPKRVLFIIVEGAKGEANVLQVWAGP